MVHILIWNRAHDDMFSKSSALPRHSFQEKSARRKEERETVYVSVVEAAGGRLAEFSANDPRRLANLFSWGLEFTQTAWVVTPTAATERESEQEVPWHAARHVTGPRLVPVQPSVFFFCMCVFVLCASLHCFRGWSFGSSPHSRSQVEDKTLIHKSVVSFLWWFGRWTHRCLLLFLMLLLQYVSDEQWMVLLIFFVLLPLKSNQSPGQQVIMDLRLTKQTNLYCSSELPSSNPAANTRSFHFSSIMALI